MATAMAVDVVPKGSSSSGYQQKLQFMSGSHAAQSDNSDSPPGVLSSASGLLSLLDEPNLDLNFAAVSRLNEIVDLHWSEIALKLDALTKLSEMTDRKESTLAALLVSKIYFHLEEYVDALEYALYAEENFQTDAKDTYTICMVSKCVEVYIASRKSSTSTEEEEEEDNISRLGAHPRLLNVLNAMIEECFNKTQYKYVIGVGFEAKEPELISRALNHCLHSSSEKLGDLLRYSFGLSQTISCSRTFRHQVVKLLIPNYLSLTTPDHVGICQCYYVLGDADAAGQLLLQLIQQVNSDTSETPDNANKTLLTAFQVAFDLVENASQQFISRVATVCRGVQPKPTEENAEGEITKLGGHLSTLLNILTGSLAQDVLLEFLYSSNKADKMVLRNIRNSISKGSRFSTVLHTALLSANAMMHAGTTVDDFTRWKETTDWLPKLKNWANFSAIAANGVIHRRHVKKSLKVLDAFLGASGNTKGGACYALGIIHAGADNADQGQVLKKLVEIVDSTPFVFPENTQTPITNVPELHGALLGIGLIAMGNHDQELFNRLYELATSGNDNADVGEAMGYALGLIMLGKGDNESKNNKKKTEEEEEEEDDDDDDEQMMLSQTLLEVALNSPHEKITRSFTIAIAFIMYGREEECERIVNALLGMQESVYRSSAVWTLALAYCGTGNHSAIQRCLHVAVSDVSDDVRRASVTALGFILHNQPETLPKLIRLLAESFNAQVRYGACMALGLACSGGAIKNGSYTMEALKLVEPMLKDKDALVRHGAMVASSMLVMQERPAKDLDEEKKKNKDSNDDDNDDDDDDDEQTVKKEVNMCESGGIFVRELRKKINLILSKPNREEVKVGAILASGILDAGGRNCCLSLNTRSGFPNAIAVIGAFMFCQRWQWEPLNHLLCLALTPTALIGLTANMKEPTSFRLKCNAPPSKFAYPDMIKKDKEKKATRVKTAVLSTTAAKKKRMLRKEKSKRQQSGSEPEKEKEPVKVKEKVKVKEEVKVEEPSDFTLYNPCRITVSQQAVTSMIQPQRFYPVVKQDLLSGIVMLQDLGKSAAVLPGEDSFDEKEDKVEGEEKKEGEEEVKSDDGFVMKDPIARMPKNLHEEPEMPEPFYWSPPEGQAL